MANREVVVCSRDGLPYSSLSLETVSSLMPILMVQSQESGEQCIAGGVDLKAGRVVIFSSERKQRWHWLY